MSFLAIAFSAQHAVYQTIRRYVLVPPSSIFFSSRYRYHPSNRMAKLFSMFLFSYSVHRCARSNCTAKYFSEISSIVSFLVSPYCDSHFKSQRFFHSAPHSVHRCARSNRTKHFSTIFSTSPFLVKTLLRPRSTIEFLI